MSKKCRDGRNVDQQDITLLTIVSQQQDKEYTVTNIIVAGAIDSVDNFTKQVGESWFCCITRWATNPELKKHIEDEWRLQYNNTTAHPHRVYTTDKTYELHFHQGEFSVKNKSTYVTHHRHKASWLWTISYCDENGRREEVASVAAECIQV